MNRTIEWIDGWMQRKRGRERWIKDRQTQMEGKTERLNNTATERSSTERKADRRREQRRRERQTDGQIDTVRGAINGTTEKERDTDGQKTDRWLPQTDRQTDG